MGIFMLRTNVLPKVVVVVYNIYVVVLIMYCLRVQTVMVTYANIGYMLNVHVHVLPEAICCFQTCDVMLVLMDYCHCIGCLC